MAEWMAAGEMPQIEALTLTHPKERNRDFNSYTPKRNAVSCVSS